MAGTSRNISAADDLDNTILRHQVHQYFNVLQEENQSSVRDTPLNMEFLGIKRKVLSSSSLRTPVPEPLVPKKIRFETSAVTDLTLSSKKQGSAAAPARAQQSTELERKLAEKQALVIDLQQKLIHAQMKSKELETEKQKFELTVSSVEESCKSRIKQFEEKIEDLHAEIEQLHQRIAELVKDNLHKKSTLEKMKLTSSEDKLAFNQQLIEKDQLLEEIQTNYDLEIKELKHKLELATWESNKHRLEAEEANSKLALQEKVSASCNHETTIEHQRQVILQMETALFAQRSVSSQSHETRLARIPQLEKEISKLQTVNQLYRETAANELLLKEQIKSLQEHLQRSKERCAAIPGLEAELNKVRTDLHEWERELRNLFNTSSLCEVTRAVEEMRRKELELASEAGGLQLEINSLQRTCRALGEQVESLRKEAKGKTELEDRVRKVERKLVVVQRDRDHYRTVNEMYEKEMTHVGAPGSASKESEQIQKLEELLEEYRKLLASCEKPEEAKGVQPDPEVLTKLNEEKAQLVQQIRDLNETVESLKLQLEQSSAKALDGDTKVLHFVSNPLDNFNRQKSEQLVQLEKENAGLRERIRLMEAGHSSNLTLLVGEKFEEGYTPERFRQLEESLKSAELKNQRTEEAFTKYCKEFRRGVFHLFGYQVDFDDSGNFKIVSVYSDSNSDHLAFKYAGEGLIIMDSPYLHTVDDLVQLHVHRQGSIPAFLAALTIELFSRQSMNNSSFTSSRVFQ